MGLPTGQAIKRRIKEGRLLPSSRFPRRRPSASVMPAFAGLSIRIGGMGEDKAAIGRAAATAERRGSVVVT